MVRVDEIEICGICIGKLVGGDINNISTEIE